MVTCADTSFLFSVYGNDVHTGKALTWLRGQQKPLAVTLFNEMELGNALRFSEFKQFLPKGSASAFWSSYLEDRKQGRVHRVECNLAEVLHLATELSELRTLTHGHRSFDILQVAAACVCKAGCFLTFDQNQRQLARHTGMDTPLD